MAAVDDFSCVRIVAAPKAQRLGGDQELARRIARNERMTVEHESGAGRHVQAESSRVTRPSIAERTQSTVLPNAISLPSSPGV